jgi:DNA (cytosine-5)-methyltransferase 1
VATGLVDAVHFGVPQRRSRAVLLANRDRDVQLPAATHPVPVAPSDVLPWAPTDLVGFPRRADTPDVVWLDGRAYRARDVRPAGEPAWTVTSKARYWRRWPADQPGRTIGVHELARLQSFPSGYPWRGSRTAQVLQLANAVPPALARHLLLAAGAAASVPDQ